MHAVAHLAHQPLVRAAHRGDDAELGGAGLGGLAGGLDQGRDVEPGRANRRVEHAGLRAEVAVLRAAAGLERDDALDLDLVAAPLHPHLVGQVEQLVHPLVGQSAGLPGLRPRSSPMPCSSTWAARQCRGCPRISSRVVRGPAKAGESNVPPNSRRERRARLRPRSLVTAAMPAGSTPPRARGRAIRRRSATLQRIGEPGLGRPAADDRARRDRGTPTPARVDDERGVVERAQPGLGDDDELRVQVAREVDERPPSRESNGTSKPPAPSTRTRSCWPARSSMRRAASANSSAGRPLTSAAWCGESGSG